MVKVLPFPRGYGSGEGVAHRDLAHVARFPVWRVRTARTTGRLGHWRRKVEGLVARTPIRRDRDGLAFGGPARPVQGLPDRYLTHVPGFTVRRVQHLSSGVRGGRRGRLGRCGDAIRGDDTGWLAGCLVRFVLPGTGYAEKDGEGSEEKGLVHVGQRSRLFRAAVTKVGASWMEVPSSWRSPHPMPVVQDQVGRSVAVPRFPDRIVSLVPSQTELLHDLGLGERVVGITRFCVHPKEWHRSKPRVGGTKQVDLDRLRALAPDLIIGNKEENSRADIAHLDRAYPVWISDVRDLASALDMVRRVGGLTGTVSRAEELAARIAEGFRGLVPLREPRSVAYLIWRGPWMAAGKDTFINDMLRRSGLVNVFADRPERYPAITPAELAASDADVVLLSSEPYPFREKHIAEVNMLLPGAPVRLVDGELFSWYGSRMLRFPAYLASLAIR